MRWSVVWTVAAAEMRLTRRLARYWVVSVLAVLASLAFYLYYSFLHMLFSSQSATVAFIGPRYLLGGVAVYFMALFMIGLVFLGYDVRARDERERVAEVVDSRPLSTLELVAGRFLGILVMAWIPAVAAVALMQLVGYALPALGLHLGQPLHPGSILVFLVGMVPPAFAWTLALVFLLVLAVRHRLVASLLGLAILVASVWAAWMVPPVWNPLLDVSGAGAMNLPSDMVGGMLSASGVLQRIGTLVIALAMVALAAAVHPRRDGGSRGRRALAGGVLALVGLAMVAGTSLQRAGTIDDLERWRARHVAAADHLRPDVQSMRADVVIRAGGRMQAEVALEVASPPGEALDALRFTLNPGLDATSVTLDGAPVDFEHRDGLLVVASPLAAAATARLALEISGRNSPSFGAVDAVVNTETVSTRNSSLYALGSDRVVNGRSVVALLPGAGWLPLAGPGADRGRAGGQGPDFFEVELSVQVPDGWLVAGPGARHAGDGSNRFRFAPGAPVDGVALIAGTFESLRTEIDGVVFEALLWPGHADVVDDLSEVGGPLEDFLEETFGQLAEAGLEYPYDGLTLVEVPNILRGFGGGWRLDTVMGPPGLVLVRENGLPTARFDFAFRDPDEFADREGGLAQAQLDRLKTFSSNDFSGTNVFANAARSFVRSRTAAAGPGAGAVNWMVGDLATQLLSGTRSYFSAHLFSPELNQAIGRAIQGYLVGGRGRPFSEAVIEAFTNRPEVWQAVLDADLEQMDPYQDPRRTLDAYVLKAGTLAEVGYEALGFDDTAGLLGDLAESHEGATFTMADFLAALDGRAEGTGAMVRGILTSTDLPAYVGRGAEVVRLEDSGDGTPRYELTARVENRSDSPGVARFVVRVGAGEEGETLREEPEPVPAGSALTLTRILTRPVTAVYVQPYLSLNRSTFALPVQGPGEEIVDRTPVEGVAIGPLAPSDDPAIVVDDLDPGFSVVKRKGSGGLRIGARDDAGDATLDHGLPVDDFGPIPGRWSRGTSASAHGLYRHTFAWTRSGKGATRAEFTTEVPRSGPYDLAVHLPNKRRFFGVRNWGVWTLTVVQNGDRQEVEFDAAAAQEGWNLLDTLELAAGEVTVEMTDDVTGQVVVADAVRWSPAGGAR